MPCIHRSTNYIFLSLEKEFKENLWSSVRIAQNLCLEKKYNEKATP